MLKKYSNLCGGVHKSKDLGVFEVKLNQVLLTLKKDFTYLGIIVLEELIWSFESNVIKW